MPPRSARVRGHSRASTIRFRREVVDYVRFWLHPELVFAVVSYGRCPPVADVQRAHVAALKEWLRRNCPGVHGYWTREFHAKRRVHQDGVKRRALHVNLFVVGVEDIDGFRVALRDYWIGLTGLGGSRKVHRLERAVVVQSAGGWGVDAARYAIGTLGVAKEASKSRQTARVDWHTGRMWGRLGKGRLAEYHQPIEAGRSHARIGVDETFAARWFALAYGNLPGAVVLGGRGKALEAILRSGRANGWLHAMDAASWRKHMEERRQKIIRVKAGAPRDDGGEIEGRKFFAWSFPAEMVIGDAVMPPEVMGEVRVSGDPSARGYGAPVKEGAYLVTEHSLTDDGVMKVKRKNLIAMPDGFAAPARGRK